MYSNRSPPPSAVRAAGIYQAAAPALRAGALADPAAAVGVYSSVAYAAVAAAAAAQGYTPFNVDSVAFYPSLQV